MTERINYVSVPALARDLGMKPNRLHYFLDRLMIETRPMGDARNSVRFVRRSDVVDIAQRITIYRSRHEVPGMTTGQVADRLGILPSTVRTLVAQRRLVARHAGHRLSFDFTEVERYASRRRRRVA